MLAAALHLVPILGAEKSKVPFYIGGGLLVCWAILVSLGIGLRKPDWPSNLAGQRAVIAITVVLVVATATTAIITSGGSKAEASAVVPSAASTQATTSTPAPASTAPTTATTPASTSPTSTASTSPSAAGSPTATTGTPAPSSSPASSAGPLKLAANPEGQLTYSTKQLSAKAGKVTIVMANMSPVPHNVTVAQGSTVEGATPTFQGGSRTLTLNLKPGTYTFYCSVPGHRQAGMEGTLNVS
jgi:plastocyanin